MRNQHFGHGSTAGVSSCHINHLIKISSIFYEIFTSKKCTCQSLFSLMLLPETDCLFRLSTKSFFSSKFSILVFQRITQIWQTVYSFSIFIFCYYRQNHVSYIWNHLSCVFIVIQCCDIFNPHIAIRDFYKLASGHIHSSTRG